MHPGEIVPFLEDELYGLEWSRVELERILSEIYATGRGFLDPASLVHGESWLDDALKFGFVDAPPAPMRPYSFNAPVRTPRESDLLSSFLDEAARVDPRAQHASTLLSGAAVRSCGPPVTLSLAECLPIEHAELPPVCVGPAPPVKERAKMRKRRGSKMSAEPAGAAVLATVENAALPSALRRRHQKTKRNILDVLIINTSGRPQLLAVLEVHRGAQVIVCQEHHCAGPSFADLQHDAKKLGWNLTGAPAVRTSREGISAGVCVAARAGISVGDIGGSFDLALPSHPGRCLALGSKRVLILA